MNTTAAQDDSILLILEILLEITWYLILFHIRYN